MPSENHSRYQGPVRAVIFDWAGTTVDYGSRAPVDAFIELFRRHGVTITAEQARGPMGSYKKDHIGGLTSDLPPRSLAPHQIAANTAL
jgi:phosphonoacetaldehyde hydrolase